MYDSNKHLEIAYNVIRKNITNIYGDRGIDDYRSIVDIACTIQLWCSPISLYVVATESEVNDSLAKIYKQVRVVLASTVDYEWSDFLREHFNVLFHNNQCYVLLPKIEEHDYTIELLELSPVGMIFDLSESYELTIRYN